MKVYSSDEVARLSALYQPGKWVGIGDHEAEIEKVRKLEQSTADVRVYNARKDEWERIVQDLREWSGLISNKAMREDIHIAIDHILRKPPELKPLEKPDVNTFDGIEAQRLALLMRAIIDAVNELRSKAWTK